MALIDLGSSQFLIKVQLNNNADLTFPKFVIMQVITVLTPNLFVAIYAGSQIYSVLDGHSPGRVSGATPPSPPVQILLAKVPPSNYP